MKKECKYCKKIIEYNHWREFACHCASCVANINVKNKYKKGVETLKKRLYKKYTLNCKKCNKEYTLELTENIFKKGKYRKNCSLKCANTKIITEEQKDKIRKSLMKRKSFFCLNCGNISESIISLKKQFCSKKCHGQFRTKINNKNITEKQIYYKKCKFKFNVWKYPDEFNLALIYKYGWYKAKNRGDNQKGISRDHIISVLYGFENNINPKLISHPANCQLLQHNINVSKGKKCDITIEELKEKINKWNKKY